LLKIIKILSHLYNNLKFIFNYKNCKFIFYSFIKSFTKSKSIIFLINYITYWIFLILLLIEFYNIPILRYCIIYIIFITLIAISFCSDKFFNIQKHFYSRFEFFFLIYTIYTIISVIIYFYSDDSYLNLICWCLDINPMHFYIRQKSIFLRIMIIFLIIYAYYVFLIISIFIYQTHFVIYDKLFGICTRYK
jgi:hypothetical protein